MKRLFALLLLLFPVFAKAQADSAWHGAFEIDCEKYVLERFIARDTMFGEMSAAILGPKVTTLLIQQTEMTEGLPDSLGGYTIRYIDPANISKTDYRMLKDSTASVLYISKPQSRYAYYDVYVMPMFATKKGRHIRARYTGKGCKAAFYMDYSKAHFDYDRTSCF